MSMMNRCVRLFVLVRPARPERAAWVRAAGLERSHHGRDRGPSENPDGTRNETTVWLAVLDNHGYIRTGDTSWYPNLERKPEIGVRIAGKDYAVTALLVTDQAVIDKVQAEFAHKYGWPDTVRGWIFRSPPHIVRLVPRAP
jgi:hypothetical protein